MPLTTGARLGPYEIRSLLGVGGMGEVYRARDTKLNRDIAIKVLLPAVANDPDRLARFSREAQVLASLNHPNIAAIYGLERLRPHRAEDMEIRGEVSASARAGGGAPAPLEESGAFALVMELVEGPTLAERLSRGVARVKTKRATTEDTEHTEGKTVWHSVSSASSVVESSEGLPLDEALPIAKQIADALEAAHEQGIVHRDLKPANIKVREDGTVKVLDFGLAKAMDPAVARSAEAGSQSPTRLRQGYGEAGDGAPVMTQAGMILGTAAYMSPEQAAGKPVDKRTDLWAFGVVLLEMLTGRQVFSGETVSHVLAAVLTKEPDWDGLPANTSAPIRKLLRRCLEKDRKRRLDSAAAARLEIEDALTTLTTPATEASPAGATRRVAALPIAFAVAGTALVATLATWVLMRPAPPVPAPVTRFQMTFDRQTGSAAGAGGPVVWRWQCPQADD